MIRRSPCALRGAALLLALVAPAISAAKPPDLPANDKDTLEQSEPAGSNVVPAAGTSDVPPSLREAIVPLPGLQALPMHVRRRLASSLLLSVHPLLPLLPTDDLLDGPNDHPHPVAGQDGCWAIPCSQSAGKLVVAGPNVKKPGLSAPQCALDAPTCPFLQAARHGPGPVTTTAPTCSALENLERLTTARRLCRQASVLMKAGYDAEAEACLEAVRELVPGSYLATEIERALAGKEGPGGSDADTVELAQKSSDEKAEPKAPVCYIILDGGDAGMQVIRLPLSPRDTVLDALSQVGSSLPSMSKATVHVNRPLPSGNGFKDLPVNYKGIVQLGDASTNYQLMPGDRIYITNHKTVGVKIGPATGPTEGSTSPSEEDSSLMPRGGELDCWLDRLLHLARYLGLSEPCYINSYSSDPNRRTEGLLHEPEDLGVREKENRKTRSRPAAPSSREQSNPPEGPGVAEQTRGLMKACRLALECGQSTHATDLARQAHALAPHRVKTDPVVRRAYEQDSKPQAVTARKDTDTCPSWPGCDAPVALRPAELPPIDPSVVAALDNLLTSARPSGEDEDMQDDQRYSLTIGLGVVGKLAPCLAITVRDNDSGEACHLVISSTGVPTAWHRPAFRSR